MTKLAAFLSVATVAGVSATAAADTVTYTATETTLGTWEISVEITGGDSGGIATYGFNISGLADSSDEAWVQNTLNTIEDTTLLDVGFVDDPSEGAIGPNNYSAGNLQNFITAPDGISQLVNPNPLFNIGVSSVAVDGDGSNPNISLGVPALLGTFTTDEDLDASNFEFEASIFNNSGSGGPSNILAAQDYTIQSVVDPNPLLADLDGDRDADVVDLDLLTGVGNLSSGIAVTPTNGVYDLDGSGTIDGTDLAQWLTDAATDNSFGSAYRAGDSDLDRDVDVNDINNLITNFDASGTNTNVFSMGDTDGDGTIGVNDINQVIGDFAASGYGDEEVASVTATAASGTVELIVDVTTGEIRVDGGDVDLENFQFVSDGGLLVDGDGTPAINASQFSSTVNEYSEGTIFGSTAVDGEVSLGILYNTALDKQDLVFDYTLFGTGQSVTGVVNYVPEPTSLALLGLGGLMIASRRRRSA